MPNLIVVAWCGNLANFGGWDKTDERGWFEIKTTNSLDCPLRAHGFLEIFREGESVGLPIADVIIHSHTTVNVKFEDHDRITVPEFGWLGGVVALAVGAGAIAFARRRLPSTGSIK